MTEDHLPEKLLAIFYLKEDGNEKHKVGLTTQRILIQDGDQPFRFSIPKVSSISTSHKKWLFPTITGGILTSLCFIAIFYNLFNPWLIIILFVIGVYLLYYGIIGFKALTVHHQLKDYHFEIGDITPNLQSFIAFLNQQLRSRKRGDFFLYHIVTKEEWTSNHAFDWKPQNFEKDGFIHLCEHRQIPGVLKRFYANQTDLILLKIDAFGIGATIKYEKGVDVGDYFPHLYGALPKSSITQAILIQ